MLYLYNLYNTKKLVRLECLTRSHRSQKQFETRAAKHCTEAVNMMVSLTYLCKEELYIFSLQIQQHAHLVYICTEKLFQMSQYIYQVCLEMPRQLTIKLPSLNYFRLLEPLGLESIQNIAYNMVDTYSAVPESTLRSEPASSTCPPLPSNAVAILFMNQYAPPFIPAATITQNYWREGIKYNK